MQLTTDNQKEPSHISSHLRWTVLAIYTLVITAISIIPSNVFEDIPPIIECADKIAHAMVYGLFAIIIMWVMHPRFLITTLQGALVILIGTSYGGLMECLQLITTVSARTFSVGDMLANAAGAIIWTIAIQLYLKRSRAK